MYSSDYGFVSFNIYLIFHVVGISFLYFINPCRMIALFFNCKDANHNLCFPLNTGEAVTYSMRKFYANIFSIWLSDEIFEVFMLNIKVTCQIGTCIIDQSHRCGHRHAACREPAGSYDKTTRTAICFEHKTQYHLIRAPYTRIVVFWHISKIPPMIGQSQISCNTPTFCIANIFVKYCYTTGSWLL